ncbi:hypothetical protein Bca4012_023311 [Brassica carinata]
MRESSLRSFVVGNNGLILRGGRMVKFSENIKFEPFLLCNSHQVVYITISLNNCKPRAEKDLGIPNDWPFKEQELKALEARRASALEEIEQKKEAHKEKVPSSIIRTRVLMFGFLVIINYEVLFCSVHMCNKLASRHVRVGLADPNNAPSCDICENAPAFFYCEIDGTSLCLQCDMVVHVGGKRTHRRFLLLKQRIEFPGDKPNHADDLGLRCQEANRLKASSSSGRGQKSNGNGDHNMIDLNSNPQRVHEPGSNHQVRVVSLNLASTILHGV